MKNLRSSLLVLILLPAMCLTAFLQYQSQKSTSEIKRLKRSPEELSAFVIKGIDWLVKVQFENGGWGAGAHSEQHIRDPHAVKVDPGTTAFASMALLRSGNTLESGKYSANLKKSLEFLLNLIEKCPENSKFISDVEGTQPQVKLGRNIDASLCVQFFIRILPHTKSNPQLEKRVNEAMDKCLRKITKSQDNDGRIQDGGWAPVLQSAMANNALEQAYEMGKVDKDALDRSKNYQKGNYSSGAGTTRVDDAAGIELYSVTSTQRATVKDARKAESILNEAKEKGKLDSKAEMNRDNLVKAGLGEKEAEELSKSYQQFKATAVRSQDDSVMSGFGNNGGEEFLSFMMTSESMVIAGGEEWNKWKGKMNDLLQRIQNQDGSWNGHHCITSPVFCTAACILSLTVENDVDLLRNEKKGK